MDGPLKPCGVSKKTNESIPRKLLVRRIEGRKALIHRTIPAITRGPNMINICVKENSCFYSIPNSSVNNTSTYSGAYLEPCQKIYGGVF